MAGIIRCKSNPVVFFDVTIGPTKLGRLKMELFADIVPKTAENVRQMCTGEFLVNSKPTGYKNCVFHKVTKDVRIEGGDIISQDGTGFISIYGQHFDDENFVLNHE
jgi:peptidyl-prolyl isomerase H (cyclophilin H)